MRHRPPDLTDAAVRAAVAAGWDLGEVTLEYLPVGAGSYHWQAQPGLFVTADDLEDKPFLGGDSDTVYENLGRALETALALRRSDLEFVVAPVEASGGGVLRRVGSRYAVAVYPYLGEPRPFRKSLSDAERQALTAMLGRLHATNSTIREHAMRIAPRVPRRAELEGALDSPEVPGLLRENAELIRMWLRRFDELVAHLDASEVERVVTHGEPHSGNIVRTPAGFALVDWDTAGLAPKERDLWMVGGGDPLLCELYRLRWRLDDLSWAVRALREQPDVALTAIHDSIDHEPFTRD